jgi:hypothetical protein
MFFSCLILGGILFPCAHFPTQGLFAPISRHRD